MAKKPAPARRKRAPAAPPPPATPPPGPLPPPLVTPEPAVETPEPPPVEPPPAEAPPPEAREAPTTGVYIEGVDEKVPTDDGRERSALVTIGGHSYHHVSDADDGTWIYRKARE